MSDAFADKYLNANKKGLLFVEQPLVFSGQTPFCSPKGKYFEHLLEFLEAIESISAPPNNCIAFKIQELGYLIFLMVRIILLKNYEELEIFFGGGENFISISYQFEKNICFKRLVLIAWRDSLPNICELMFCQFSFFLWHFSSNYQSNLHFLLNMYLPPFIC
jgi:hypothetical protein